MKPLILVLPLLAALPLTASAVSEVPPYSQEQLDSIERTFSLNEVVVTGTRTPKVLKDTPIQTRLITEAEIRRVDATDIQDLLQQELPGIEFSYAMNQQTNMNMAGFSGQGVLLLLDGERLAGETMENTDFSRLDLNGISRIEIIRGAASALYGSSAAGGVINLISKEADKPWRASLNVRVADHNEWRIGGQLALRTGRVSNSLDATYRSIDTYTVCLDTKDFCDFRNVFGHYSVNVRDRLVYTPLSGLKLTGRAGYYFKQRLYNPDTPDRYRDFSGGVRADWDIDRANRIELSYSFDQYDKSDYIKDFGLDVRDYSNVQHALRGLYTSQLRDGDLMTVGADFMRDYLDTYQFGPGETHRQYTADVFGQYDMHIDSHWELVGALRWDYFSDGSNNHLTGKLNARYVLDAVTLRGGYSGGFRAPTLKEKYMDYNMADIFDIHGNPDLHSETSHNFSLSAEYAWRNYYMTVGSNYSFVNDRISTSGIRYSAPDEPYIQYVNVDDLRVASIDATVRARWLNGLSASLSYCYTHEDSHSTGITQYCPARPHSLNARLSWTRRWTKGYTTDVTISGRFLSRVSYLSMYMYEPFEEYRITNPAYTLWKAQLTQHITDRLRITVAVDNIFNYAPAVYSFNAPVTLGANLMVGMAVDIN